jgi:peroxiredoxin
VELRSTFEALPDVRVVWVMADSQVNDKALRFIDGMGLRDRIVFAVDPASAAIDRLGLRLENAEPMEQGVPHPTTYVLDREGVVRFADSRRDYHFWLDAERIAVAVQGL